LTVAANFLDLCSFFLFFLFFARFLSLRMKLRNFFNKADLCFFDITQCLSRHGLRMEEYEIDRVPLGQSITDFGITFGAADARTVAGSGIDDYDRYFFRVNGICFLRQDTGQVIVHRPV
jgi:hypothetical protein